MDEKLKKIYERVIYHEKKTQQIEKGLEIEIHKLLNPYLEQFSKEDMEIIYSLMYAIQLRSMQEGFQQGLKYTLSSLFALLSES